MTKPFRLYFMSAFMFFAGVIHLITPDMFMPAIPPFFPTHYLIIYISGIFEIILAVFLLRNKNQDLAAKTLACYFLLLLPVHFYVAYYGIEIFGVSSKSLLWIRTALQFVLYFWAISLQKESWVIKQTWRDVLFLHYRVNPNEIKNLVPFELDLYDNHAIISVIPFFMDSIRFPFLPPIPKVSGLWELNIRTYVNVNGVKGIYFFTLETDSKPGEVIGNLFFNLPYRHSKIQAGISHGQYIFKHARDDLRFSVHASPDGNIQKTDFDIWATERYSLFTQKNGISYRGIVRHKPWELTAVNVNKIENNFTKMVIPDVGDIVGASYAKVIRVSFQNFRKFYSKQL